METVEYLRFVGRLKGLSGAELEKRVAFVLDRCAIADVKMKLLGKLSKGYRQRVGLAQAIIHNPDVLILDEPTAGLDPKQINETRDLIKSLAGDHTIILSTHILPEVEQTCEQVHHHQQGQAGRNRLGAQPAGARPRRRIDAAGGRRPQRPVRCPARAGAPREDRRRQPRRPQRGVRQAARVFEVEASKGQLVRGDLARAVVESGWDLNELRPAAMSLEEIFLQLTGSEAAASPEPATTR